MNRIASVELLDEADYLAKGAALLQRFPDRPEEIEMIVSDISWFLRQHPLTQHPPPNKLSPSVLKLVEDLAVHMKKWSQILWATQAPDEIERAEFRANHGATDAR